MIQETSWSDPAIVAALMATASAFVTAILGIWINARISSDQRKARLADFENENLRELRGHIANILEANVRKLALTHKLDTIAPQGLAPDSHPSVVEEFIRTARDRDDTLSSLGNAYEHIRLMLIEQTDDNVALVAEVRKSLDAKTNDDLLRLSILPTARAVIQNKLNSIRSQL
jgi:hypothetical protein